MLTVDELKKIMIVSAGEDESADLGGAFLDVPFRELGYDSLAMLEIASQVQRAYGVIMNEDEVAALVTPRAVFDLVNSRLAVA